MGAFDIRLCQIPTIAPYMPKGGVVGQYIDRRITLPYVIPHLPPPGRSGGNGGDLTF